MYTRSCTFTLTVSFHTASSDAHQNIWNRFKHLYVTWRVRTTSNMMRYLKLSKVLANLESWILSPDFWTFKVFRSFKGFWLFKISISIESVEKLRRFQSHKNLMGRCLSMLWISGLPIFSKFWRYIRILKNSNSRSNTFKTYINSRFNTYQDWGILNIESGSSSYNIEKLGIPFWNWNLNKIEIINYKILLSNSIKRTGKVTMWRISLMNHIIICDS